MLGFHRRARPASRDFDRSADQARDRERDEHRQKNPRPFLVSAPAREPKKGETYEKMFRPVAKPAHVLHEIPHARRLMGRHERDNRRIVIKRDSDDDGRDHDAKRPVEKRAVLHK